MLRAISLSKFETGLLLDAQVTNDIRDNLVILSMN